MLGDKVHRFWVLWAKMFRRVNERVGLFRLHIILNFWLLGSSKQFIPNTILFSANIKLSVRVWQLLHHLKE